MSIFARAVVTQKAAPAKHITPKEDFPAKVTKHKVSKTKLVDHGKKKTHHMRQVKCATEAVKKRATLDQIRQVVSEHRLSAPLVSALESLNLVQTLLVNFPQSQSLNTIPESKHSAKQAMGMESLDAGIDTVDTEVVDEVSSMSDTFGEFLDSLGPVVDHLREDLIAAQSALAENPPTEECLETEGEVIKAPELTSALVKITEALQELPDFDLTELREDPSKLEEQVEGLKAVVDELGSIIGIDLTEDGIEDNDDIVDEDLDTVHTTLKDAEYTAEGLAHIIELAISLTDELLVIFTHRESIAEAFRGESTKLPSLSETEAGYTTADHVPLCAAYSTLLVKLITEAEYFATKASEVAELIID